MTYFGFLAIFVGVPLAVMAALTWSDARRGRGLPVAWAAPAAVAVLGVHVFLAVVYTTPWDNYLVATRVWYYNPARVTGVTLGWVPIEEYTFFVVQTLLTGAWLLWVARHLEPAPEPVPRRQALRLAAVVVGGLIWLASIAILIAGWQPGTYLGLTLAWLIPPVLLQLLVGGDVLWHHRRWVALALVPPVVYLCIADAVAIASGVWTINPVKSTGIMLGSVLPLEEFVFFLVTNVLIVFGMGLMLTTGRRLYAQIGDRLGPRANAKSDERLRRADFGANEQAGRLGDRLGR